MSGAVNKAQFFATLPQPWPEDPRPQIRAAVASQPSHKLVVLDDDPTGTQTVHDVPVLTVWDVDALRAELGPETKFPGLPYVVFPGNVGGSEALQDAVQKLKT